MQWMPNWTWRSLLLAALRVFATLWAIAFGALYFFQERLIFQPTHLPPDYKFHFDSPFEERWITSGGLKINTLYFPVPQSAGLILHFHGNAGSLADWGEVAREIAWRTGWSVWIVDYPGYGKSEGSISSEEQLYELGRDFVKAAANEAHGGPVVIYGRSIGTGIAAHSATPEAAGLILESPYYSLRNLAATIAPWAPLWLLKYSLETFKNLPSIPTLIFHGDQDEVIPFTQGKKLAAAAKSTFVTIPGGHHNDLSESDLYWRELKAYLHARSIHNL